MTEASVPTTAASSSTERLIWRRVAPMARIRASSRVRWAISMVKVLAMRKMPTNSAMPAKASSMVLRLVRPDSMSLACWSASALPVCASASLGSSGSISASSFRSETPSAAETVALWKTPGFR
ncbi:hypothetical protein SGRI78S_00568 [Streptomyces griseus subsp. griseus]